MSLVRIAFAGLALLAFASLPGCGGGGDDASSATADATDPNAGLEASKKIMDMQPPPPPGARKAGGR